MAHFDIKLISAKTGEHTAKVTLSRAKLLPCWYIEFANGAQYLLIYFDKRWGAVEGEGLARPSATLVGQLAKKIIVYLIENQKHYRSLISEIDRSVRHHVEFPTWFDYGLNHNPPIHSPAIIGAGDHRLRG